ncbi:tetratricopeptide repeat protein [bacterium]|nr:tetratricopeptide repeat protein [bacterium]
MGIHDRDCIRRDSAAPSDLLILLCRIGLVLFGIFVLAFCLRMPAQIYIKLPLVVGLVIFLKYLWDHLVVTKAPRSFSAAGKAAEKRGNYSQAAKHYEMALKQMPSDLSLKVRLLAAYHASKREASARSLIASLSGRVISGEFVEELERLVSSSQKVAFVPSESGFKMALDPTSEY